MLTSLAKAMVTPTPLPVRAPIHVRTPIPVVEEEPAEVRSDVAAANTRIGKNWSASEDQEMLTQVRQGVAMETIAKQHNRTPGGVRNRLLKLVHQMSLEGNATLDEVCATYHVTAADVEAFLEVNRERAAAKKAAQQPTVSSSKRPLVASQSPVNATRKAASPASDVAHVASRAAAGSNQNNALRSALLELSDYLKLMANRMAH